MRPEETPSARRSALVVTVVHHPEDARIRHRQIPALLEAGWQVTYAAPFTVHGLPLPPPLHHGAGELRCLDVPRAVGRRRLPALIGGRRVLQELGPRHDVTLVHDPELMAVSAGLRGLNVVWDVHEDTAAAVEAKAWVPRPLRRTVAAISRTLEHAAERRMPLLLAEYQYQERFRLPHPVVPNTVAVPEQAPRPGADRVVYLGTLTLERGAAEVAEVGRLLHERSGGEVRLDVIGPAHGEARDVLAGAADRGVLSWHGFVPSGQALGMLTGALAGLSLLRDLPNYRHSMPTKVVEYMAHGVPVITTPLPVAAQAVEGAGAGIVVPFRDPAAAAQAVLELRSDPERAARLGAAGHRTAREAYDWSTLSGAFVDLMERFAVR